MEIGDRWEMIRKVFDEAYKSCYPLRRGHASTRMGRRT